MEVMAEDWDNCCPLCMEEMDPTDRQLKPCRCGYQVITPLVYHVKSSKLFPLLLLLCPQFLLVYIVVVCPENMQLVFI